MPHTPGPWTVSNSDLRGGRYWTVNVPGYGEPIDIHEDDNGQADAQLIAAAPDLLVALDNLLAAMEMAQHLRPETQHRRACIDQAKNALAKARGEQQ